MTMRVALVLAAGLLLASLAPARAHMPYLSCARQGDVVRCKGGFTGGRSVAGVRIDVVADDGAVLIEGVFDAGSSFTFSPPAQGYYVLLDAGPGHTIEVDDQDVVDP